MSGQAPRPESRFAPSTVPHPVLTKYYRHAEERRPFVTSLFDSTAAYYEWVCAMGSLGSDRFYRRWVLEKTGLRRGMKLLDVATGTGLVAGAAVRILRDPRAVVGLDPSRGMLLEARKALTVPLVQGMVEELPFGADHFDFLTIGYALRHVADLGVAFSECWRVLKRGGCLLMLEISRPRSVPGDWLFGLYLNRLVPFVTRLCTRSAQAELLMKYYWDTIAECVPPATIVDVLGASGFVDIQHRRRGGLLSEYTALKPAR